MNFKSLKDRVVLVNTPSVILATSNVVNIFTLIHSPNRILSSRFTRTLPGFSRNGKKKFDSRTTKKTCLIEIIKSLYNTHQENYG